jgi:stage V sporulation protein B
LRLGFVRTTALTFISNLLAFVISIAATVVLSRFLGPAGRGVVDVGMNFLSFSILILGLGLPMANVFVVGKESKELSAVLGSNLLLAVPTVFLLIPLFFLNQRYQFQFLRGITDLQFFLVLITIPFLNLKSSIINIFLGLQEMVDYNKLNIIDRLLNLLLVTSLLITWPNPTAALMATLINAVILCLWTSLLLLKRNGVRPTYNISVLKQLVNYGMQSVVGNTIQKLNYRLDLFIINYYLPLNQVGFYGAAVVIAETLWGVSGSIATVIFPMAAASGNEKEMYRFTNQVTRISFALITLFSLILAVISKPLILIFFGQSFLPSVTALLWLLPGIAIFSVSNILANYLAGVGLAAKNTYSAMIASIVTIALNLLLIPWIGIIGASIATSISYSVFTFTTLMFYRRKTQSTLSEILILRQSDIEFVKDRVLSGLLKKNKVRNG